MENIKGVNNLELLQDLTEEEKQEVLKILQEVTEEGKSNTYNELLEKDYDEIPVDIETFLKDKRYLGKGLVNEEGTFTVYRYWQKTLKEIFPDPLKPATCNILALSGGIGLGKSFMAVLCGLYELYRMLCLKNPYVYYGLQPIDKITFAFMNITLDASKGVAWDKMQQLLQSSDWFMEKGTVTGTVNQEWHPPKGIELIAGSLSRHIIGRAVFFCLDGDTEILTKDGIKKLSTLENKEIQVYSVNNQGKVELSESCTVKQTAQSEVEYEIELEDGTVLKCTPNHRFMLIDGTYKEAQYLTEEDELFSPRLTLESLNAPEYSEFINQIIEDRGRFNVEGYKERHHIIPKCLGGDNKLDNLIDLTAKEHFEAHKLLFKLFPKNKSLFFAWHNMAFCRGKTQRNIELTGDEYEELRKLQSEMMQGNTNFLSKRGCVWNKGLTKDTSLKVRQYAVKCSVTKTGVKLGSWSESHKLNFKRSIQNRGYENYHGQIGKKAISSEDGETLKFIPLEMEIPEGYLQGNCKTSKPHDMSKYLNDSEARRRISEIRSGKNNPMYQKGYKVSGDKNGHAIHFYYYADKKFMTKNDLISYLKDVKGLHIPKPTITKICKGEYTERLIKKYGEDIKLIRRELK